MIIPIGKYKWHKVVHLYKERRISGKKLPEDGKWVVWKDYFGNVEICRMKSISMGDYFIPDPKLVNIRKVRAWRLPTDKELHGPSILKNGKLSILERIRSRRHYKECRKRLERIDALENGKCTQFCKDANASLSTFSCDLCPYR